MKVCYKDNEMKGNVSDVTFDNFLNDHDTYLDTIFTTTE